MEWLSGRSTIVRWGRVNFVNPCCVQFETRDQTQRQSVSSLGIFDVQYGLVTLICQELEVHRYSCPVHPLTASTPRVQWMQPQLARRALFSQPRAARFVGSHQALASAAAGVPVAS